MHFYCSFDASVFCLFVVYINITLCFFKSEFYNEMPAELLLFIHFIISNLDYNENHSITHLTIKLLSVLISLSVHLYFGLLKHNDDLEPFNELYS